MLPIKIGSCTNDGTNYTFYEHCQGRVIAQISGKEEFYSVNCKSGLFFDCRTIVERVQRLLESCRFAPIYSEKEKRVEFKLRSTDGWEMLNEKNYPEEIKVSRVLSNGGICLITSSKIDIWDPVSGKETVFPAGVEFAAVAEYKCGELLLGDHSGNIYFNGSKIAFISDKKIEQIVVLSEKRILARVVGQVFLIDLEKLKVEQSLEVGGGAEIANEGAIYHLQNGFTVHRVKNGVIVEHLNIPKVMDYRLLEQTHLLLAEKKKRNRFQVTLWNLQSGKRSFATVCQYRVNQFFNRQESLFPLGDDGLVNPKKEFFHIEGDLERLRYQPSASNIYAAAHLSDGSIAFDATDGLHIDGGYHETFHARSTKGKEVKGIYELSSGALAIVGKKTIQVFQAVFIEKRYQQKIDEGLRALQELDFRSARLAYQAAKNLCPDNRQHQTAYLEALRVFSREKHRSTAGMRYAKHLLREVEEDAGISNLSERRYYKHLIVGDGDLTFSEALVKKHPEIAEHLVVTELSHPMDVAKEKYSKFSDENEALHALSRATERCFLKGVEERMAYLKRLGAEVCFGVNAKQLNKAIPDERFHRIRWNFPPIAKEKDVSSFTVLPRFFRAAARMQKPGDKVLIGLDQIPSLLLPAALLAGYKPTGKRRIDEKRFPGYLHHKDRLGYLVARTEHAREFVFVKTEAALPSSKSFSSDLLLLIKNSEGGELTEPEQVRVVEMQTEIDELEVVKEAEDPDNGGRYFQHDIVCDTESDSPSYYSE